jgi:hypothetical protein
MTPEKRQLKKAFVENKQMYEAVCDVMLVAMTGSTLEREVIDDAHLIAAVPVEIKEINTGISARLLNLSAMR